MTIALATQPKVKLKVDDFDLLAEAGALTGLERTELLDGDIYLRAPQYTRHAAAKSFVYDALLDWKRVHRRELVVRTEASVAMPPNDEPMPDVILCQRPTGRRGIDVATAALLVEIADTTRDIDLGYKAELYARQGVREYWVVDLKAAEVVVHSDATADGYAHRHGVKFGEIVRSVTLDGLMLDTLELRD